MTPDQARRLGTYLRTRREQRGISARALARQAGLRDTTVIRIEHGEFNEPTPDTLASIAAVLELDLGDLYARVDYPLIRQLPSLAAYLQLKYPKLPADAAQRIARSAQRIADQHGVILDAADNPKRSKPGTRGSTSRGANR
jgi:transcriptional regulator with XRE-family HTH domain